MLNLRFSTKSSIALNLVIVANEDEDDDDDGGIVRSLSLQLIYLLSL